MPERRTALVSGGSSGIGLSCAGALARAGWQVYTLSRRSRGPEGFCHISCDVTDPQRCREAVEQVLREAGGLELLVNCAGCGISGAVEFASPEDVRLQVDVNLMGTTNLCRAVLPHFRQQRRGRIINVSSVAAVTPIPFQTWYSVTKAGINAYTMALANEVRRFGVSVCAVMPGDTRTGFTDARKRNTDGDGLYGGAVSRSVSRMEHDERSGASPDRAAAKILRLASKRHVPPLSTVGLTYQLCVLLVKLLPASLANRILYLLYGK